MPKQTFTINDFSGGSNGYVDPLDIADNELAQCQGFKAEPGVVSVLGDMKAAYTPSAASENIDIEPGYGLFAFSQDYTDAGALASTNYLVLMDGVYFEIYSDEVVDSGSDDDWVQNAFNLGTAASDASFAGSIKPCFFIVDGALRVSPGNFTAKDNGEQLDGALSAQTAYGFGLDLTVDAGTASNHVTVGDTIVISGQEMIVLRVTDAGGDDTIAVGRNMTGSFVGALVNNATIYSVLDTRWRGVVKRRNFMGVTTGGTFTEWYSTYSHPRPPVLYSQALAQNADNTTLPFFVHFYDKDTSTNNDENDPGLLHVGYKNDTTNNDATWDGAAIYLYVTALYDEIKQESHPHKHPTSITVAAADDLAIWIGVCYVDGSSNYVINKRVTGARIYYEDATNEPGILFQLIEVDFEKGCKKADSEAFTVWEASTGDISVGCPDADGRTGSSRTSGNAFIFANPPKSFTYELNTLYPPDVNTHARYKTAVVAGNRLYAGNIFQSGKIDGDRMIASPVHKYDILPEIEPNVIRVSAGDGDEIIKLEAYADRILQFKKRTLYIVNISGPLGDEFLESQHKNMGVENPSQTCMTEYGVAWVNAHGVFLYDGQNIIDLTLNKLQSTNTTDRPRALNITESNIPIIGYHPDNKWLVIHPQSTITDANDVEAWIHDFKNGSWTYTQEFTTTDDYKSNMIWTSDNNLVFAAGTNSSNTPDFFKYRTPAANMSQDKLLFLTKEFSLDAPGVKKKLKGVYITYSASADSYIEADILYKHPTGVSTDDLEEANSGSTYYTEALGFKSTSGAVRTVELVPTTPVTNAYTFQLKLHNDDAAYPHGADFKLYNVSFVYRPLGVR